MTSFGDCFEHGGFTGKECPNCAEDQMLPPGVHRLRCRGCGDELNCSFQRKVNGEWQSWCGDCWLEKVVQPDGPWRNE